MREHGNGTDGGLVVVGAIGDAASPETVFLTSMRLNCRGVRTANLGTGLTLAEAAEALARHHRADALLLLGGARDRRAPRLARLAELSGGDRAAGPLPVDLAEILPDLTDTAFLFAPRSSGPPGPSDPSGPPGGYAESRRQCVPDRSTGRSADRGRRCAT
ncbi:hypothetical protein [Streptomyces beihaiensis]|uniref:Uncharacterized protein n=1 Tax=Streptomyces beihaiensis TaxID=2984495 RepID=A0ABT3U2W7_9ACTN|nr:hypothetical protein [Streptomyces beihaiensis]MCX3063654.1 hypothetical protein [Streptomyces beihaiensis]